MAKNIHVLKKAERTVPTDEHNLSKVYSPLEPQGALLQLPEGTWKDCKLAQVISPHIEAAITPEHHVPKFPLRV